MYIKLFAAACALCAGTAFAQSHSTTNQANPPGTDAASSAATEATPGQAGTAGQAKKDARPNGKTKPGKKARSKEEGAEGQMQHRPSEQTSEAEKRAFDKTPQTK